MDISLLHSKARRLRVLLVGHVGAASVALTAWLNEQEMIEVGGPANTTTASLVLATEFKPDVVLLDFHGHVASIGSTISFFKKLSSTPLVLVLTHDASPTMRRHCHAARTDSVFDKTTELDEVAALLAQTRQSIGFSDSATARCYPKTNVADKTG